MRKWTLVPELLHVQAFTLSFFTSKSQETSEKFFNYSRPSPNDVLTANRSTFISESIHDLWLSWKQIIQLYLLVNTWIVRHLFRLTYQPPRGYTYVRTSNLHRNFLESRHHWTNLPLPNNYSTSVEFNHLLARRWVSIPFVPEFIAWRSYNFIEPIDSLCIVKCWLVKFNKSCCVSN